MIENSNQIWQVGKEVQVGFMVLTIIEKIPTPKDGMPDQYLLQSKKGKKYIFTPHYGIKRYEEETEERTIV